MEHRIRRVVTGHDADGSAVFKADEWLDMRRVGLHEIKEAAEDPAYFGKLWTSVQSPADINDDTDGALRASGLTLPGGSVLRIVDMPPHHRSPMHRTQSLDYGLVLVGRAVLELDAGRRVALSAGDVVVQRGTIHAWLNETDEWARLAFVLLDATPAVTAAGVLEPSH